MQAVYPAATRRRRTPRIIHAIVVRVHDVVKTDAGSLRTAQWRPPAWEHFRAACGAAVFSWQPEAAAITCPKCKRVLDRR